MNHEANATHSTHHGPAELVAANATGRAELSDVRLSPWGEVKSTMGTYVMDDDAAAEIVAAFKKHGTALPIDREHETLPENTPAAGSRGAVGWIEDVWAEPGVGLRGGVRWTEEGRALIRQGAFRYLSPVLLVRKSDRRAVALHSAAMTNKPAIPQMDRLAASEAVPAEVGNAVWAEPMIPHPSQVRYPVDADRIANANTVALAARHDADVARTVREYFRLKPDADGDTVQLALTMAGMQAAEERRKVAEEDEKAWNIVSGFFSRHLLNRNSSRAVRAALKIARDDPDALEALYGLCNSKIPPGTTVAPTPEQCRRWDAFTDLKNQYYANRQTQKLTTLVDFVASELQARKMAPLCDYERVELEKLSAARP